jgi:hypothetical protein
MSNYYNLSFKNTKTIYEYEINCTIPAGSLNSTLNPTAKEEPASTINFSYAGIVSSSQWCPYATQIGLYDDNLNLVVVAKVNQPVKIFNDIDMTFCIRFDI